MSEQQKKSMIRIAVGVVLFAVLLILQYGGILYRIEALWVRVLITTVLAIAAYTVGGLQVLLKAADSLTKGLIGHPDVIAVLATFGAFALGDYTDAVAVILLFAVSELIASFLPERERAFVRELKDVLPEKAKVQRNGVIREISPMQIQEGEAVVVDAGEKIPADGKVIEGASVIDVSFLTGVEEERKVKIGDTVLAGTVNDRSLLVLQAVKSGKDSFFGKVIAASENREDGQGKLMQKAMRFPIERGLLFAGLAVTIAAAFAILYPEDQLTWIRRGLAMLIPAAALSPICCVPHAFSEGLAALIRNRVFPKNAAAIEKCAGVRTLTVGKQGTITQGEVQIGGVMPSEDAEITAEELLSKVAAMTLFSKEPAAKAIRAACRKSKVFAKITETEEVQGRGIRGKMNGAPFAIGAKEFVEANTEEKLPAYTGTVLYVAESGRYLGAVLIEEHVNEAVREDLALIRKAGVSTILLASDGTDSAADQTAEELGFDGAVSGMEKTSAKAGEKHESGQTAYAGLIRSREDAEREDVSIAVNALSAGISEEPDLTLMDADLSKLEKAFRISRKVRKTALTVLIGSAAAALVLMTLSAAGILSMGPAALGTTVWFVFCVFLSLRIRKEGEDASSENA